MKKRGIGKLTYERLSNERRAFARVLSYVLERVFDPYCDDKFFHSDDTCPDESSYYLRLINEELKEL